MKGITHITAAITIASTFTTDISLLGISALGSVIPDIDHPHSIVGRKIPIIPELFNLFFGHRTLTHSLLGLIGTSLFIYLKSPSWAVAWVIGYGSHLILDMLTPSGVPLLWPRTKNLGFNLVQTGGVLENIFLLLLFLIHITTPWGKGVWSGITSSFFSFLSF